MFLRFISKCCYFSIGCSVSYTNAHVSSMQKHNMVVMYTLRVRLFLTFCEKNIRSKQDILSPTTSAKDKISAGLTYRNKSRVRYKVNVVMMCTSGTISVGNTLIT